MLPDKTLVVGIFRDRAAAQRCYDMLLGRGFHDTDVNVMMSEQTRHLYGSLGPDTPAIGKSGEGTKAAEGVGIGGAVGTAIGGSIAAIIAIGTSLVLPGLNLIVAGPLVAALAGGGAGAVAGGLLGGLVGLGIPEENADAYHLALREGGTLIGVDVTEREQVGPVKQLMIDCGGADVHSVD